MGKTGASILFVLSLLSFMTIACEPSRFNIFYLPIEAEFYVPPTREYILQHGTNVEIDSSALSNLFKKISEQNGVVPQGEEFKGLRILIINKGDGREVFITSGKNVLSGNKQYIVDVAIVDNSLKDIVESIEKKQK